MQTLDYRNFEYKGFHSMGACFVRVRIKDDGSLVCLIAQLRDYNGTSVTNVIEDIMYGVVKRLDSEKALPKALSSMDKILERSVWIERYAPGLGISPDGSWAIVTLDSERKPDWTHASFQSVVAHCGVEPAFLDLTEEDLRHKR
ncbi:hypothetical protein RX987_03775 [Pseudomonas syringae pv. actinidiae]|uniref:Uncharacterized conserved protein n=5 Tax=Pseudomonas TaxID=286 RepID=M1J5E5_PSESF|nr:MULTISPECIES: hypothetical protein [Pseudomonas]EPN83829.1 hypothetical protein A234_11834 [Pseudomonas syringae pv. actinidiae ICMP 19101]POD81173.1 hypothetical protein BKM17_00680 [Pseudomonas syringae group genomosp. 3]AGE82099.1 hypothetical protein [Pseudomonas syringae pv. actinidiae]AGE82215.1 hypothetical protein [Pseudomonas syringae pv. actinidiae]AKT32664.1 hypothetical protein IYO_024690 [Pseudomonas syringae pv. actinidiae ICMP 18884]